MTIGGTYNKQLRRGNKRRQNWSSDSGSDYSGINLKDVLEGKKPSSRPVSPKAGETLVDEITRTVPEAGWPGSSSQRKAEINEPDSKRAPPPPLALNEPLNIRGKETCESGKCKSRHDRSGSDILRNHLKRYPHNVLVGGYEASRGKKKEISKKYSGSDTSMSAGNSRERKRVRTGSATDDSFNTLLMKVEEVSSKLNSPTDAGQSSKHRSKYDSKQSSKQTKSVDSGSMNSRSSYSGKSSPGRSSGRSSARSVESMDGHTELLESLVLAAHAEDKLHREKDNLQSELQKLQQRNDELEQELLYTLKLVDKLRTKYKHASRNNHEMERKFHSEKAELEKEIQAALKQEQIALNKDKSAPTQKH